MKFSIKIFCLSAFCLFKLNAQDQDLSKPMVTEDAVFKGNHDTMAIEAEHFYKQTNTQVRRWYRTSVTETPKAGRDEDDNHAVNASNQAYIEILPDERITHSDKLVQGANFTNKGGELAVLHYKVKIDSPGCYYVWVRAFSTGSEDNGLHVGFNNAWPESGQRMQWCDGKGTWKWESKQRTKEQHCGVPHLIYLDIDTSGVHDIQFSMREDGFEFDKFILTKNMDYFPKEEGPMPVLVQGKLPKVNLKSEQSEIKIASYFNLVASSNKLNKAIAAQAFPIENTNFYKEGKNWLAINPKLHETANTSITFNFNSGKYDVLFIGVGENDGSSSYKIMINNKALGSYNPPLSVSMFEEGKPYNALWEKIKLKKGDKITVMATIGSADGKEHTRGPWAGIIFAPVGKGKVIQEAPSSYTAK